MIKYVALVSSYNPFTSGYSDNSYSVYPLECERETPKRIYFNNTSRKKISDNFSVYSVCDSEKEAIEYLINSLIEKSKSIVRTIKSKEAEHFEIEQKLMDLKGEDKWNIHFLK